MPEEKQTGSPKGESLYLAIGFIRRPHGVRGEMIMDLHTDFPERIKPGRKIYIGEKYQPATFDTVRLHQDSLLISLRGYETPEAIGRFRNQWVYIQAKEAPPLPEGQHYKYELLDLTVVDDAGNLLGKLAEILETGANDVYIVRDEAGKEILLPAIPAVILNVDMTARQMTVHLMDGLI
ncbi:MAG: 16S rRNA processing protein RimM [Anaerolineales bacterium]|nr:16S rRNA processing protein RimM [Anaerolineales bacterium]